MKKNIWVVDDDESILEVMQVLLEGEGYLVKTFVNGHRLQELDAHSELPDLILLDVLLSGEDGRDICKRLKHRQETKDIPIIMLSAHSSAGKVASVCGADDFLGKPFDIDALIGTVEKHLS